MQEGPTDEQLANQIRKILDDAGKNAMDLRRITALIYPPPFAGLGAGLAGLKKTPKAEEATPKAEEAPPAVGTPASAIVPPAEKKDNLMAAAQAAFKNRERTGSVAAPLSEEKRIEGQIRSLTNKIATQEKNITSLSEIAKKDNSARSANDRETLDRLLAKTGARLNTIEEQIDKFTKVITDSKKEIETLEPQLIQAKRRSNTSPSNSSDKTGTETPDNSTPRKPGPG